MTDNFLRPPKLRKVYLDNGECKNLWDIQVPFENSLYWSLFICYSISVEDSQLGLLFENGSKNNVCKQLRSYNPFLNRGFLFNNESINEEVLHFQKKLQPSSASDDRFDIASEFLHCKIIVFDCDSNETSTFMKCLDDECPSLFLFLSSSKECSQEKVFSFGLQEDTAVPMRRSALVEILSEFDYEEKKIEYINEHYDFFNNFLMFLLKNSYDDLITMLFKSSYSLIKLSEAAFIIHPCCLDEDGLSAFCHCFRKKRMHPLIELFNYGVCNDIYSDENLRNPGIQVFRNIEKIEKVIRQDREKTEHFSSFGAETQNAEKSFQEFHRYLSFLKDFTQKVIQVVDENQSTWNVKDSRRVMIYFLNTYQCYFHYETNSPKVLSFAQFLEFRHYYECLDNYFCLFLFDNVLKLKLDRNCQCMPQSVIGMFWTVLGYHAFNSIAQYGKSVKEHLQMLRFIPFSERKTAFATIPQTVDELNRYINSKEHNPNAMADCIRMTMRNHPEIRDHFLCDRVEMFSKAASKTNIQKNKMQSILTIQRALQVIGETMYPSSKNSVIGYLLASCLPEKIVGEIIKIRHNCLSHGRPLALLRIKLEEEDDCSFFRGIFEDLVSIHKAFQGVYLSQFLRVQNKMIQRCSRYVEAQYSERFRVACEKVKSVSKDMFWTNKKYFKFLANNILEVCRKSLTRQPKTCDLIGEFSALKFILRFILIHSGTSSVGPIVEELEIFNEEKLKNITKHKRDIETCFTKISNTLQTIFEDVEIRYEIHEYPNICSYINTVASVSWLSKEDVSVFNDIVGEKLKLSVKSVDILIAYSTSKSPMVMDNVCKEIENVLASDDIKRDILEKFERKPKSASGVLKTLKLSSNDLNDDLKEIKSFLDVDEYRSFILRTNFPFNVQNNLLTFMNRRLECLITRVYHMKSILIEADSEICSLWEKEDQTSQKLMKQLMVERYIDDIEVRASLETLLFDCYNIFDKRKDLESLWIKAQKLFTGINLRNVLSHGYLALDKTCSILDPEDLPNELIDKMLEFIDDKECIQSIIDLWKELKCETLCDFQKHVEKKENIVTGTIKKCKRWKIYSQLLPVKF